MFIDSLRVFGDKIAVSTANGINLSYDKLANRVDDFAEKLGEKRRLVVVETANEIEPLVAYLGAMRGRHPVILVGNGATVNDKRIKETFRPYGVFDRL